MATPGLPARWNDMAIDGLAREMDRRLTAQDRAIEQLGSKQDKANEQLSAKVDAIRGDEIQRLEKKLAAAEKARTDEAEAAKKAAKDRSDRIRNYLLLGVVPIIAALVGAGIYVLGAH